MTKVKITKTDPPVTVKEGEFIRSRTPLDDTADIRDDLALIVGGGNPSLKNDDVRGSFARMQSIMGQDKAAKLMDAIYLHSQRPEVMAMKTPEERINSFYSIGSSNQDIAPYIQRAKTFGYGVIPGFRDSRLLANMILSGREKPTAAVAEVNPELAKKIMVRIAKK